MFQQIASEKAPLISVVVPIFNVEHYLESCLRSIQKQTYEHLQVICVNDGSTDQSLKIIDSFCQDDERFSIINKSNGGLSSARNAGLKHVIGDYVVFVDSDDLLPVDAISEMVEAVAQTSADILVFGAERFIETEDSEQHHIYCEPLSPRPMLYNSKAIIEDAIFDEPLCNIYVWNKMYTASLLMTGIQFDESILLGEDRCFLFDIFPFANSLQIIDKKLYQYRQKRKSSLTSLYSGRQYEKCLWKVKMIQHIYSSWAKNRSDQVTDTARLNLYSWSKEYIERSVYGLNERERLDILSRFQSMKYILD